MAMSIGEGITRGLQTGMGLMLQQRQQERAEQQQQFQQDLATKQEARAQEQADALTAERQRVSDRQAQSDAIASIDKDMADTVTEMGGLLKKYGGDPNKVPPAELQPFVEKRDTLRAAKTAALQKNYQPFVDQFKQKAQDTLSGLQTGRLKLGDDVSLPDFLRAVTATTGRDPMDFIGKDGKPSVVEQGANDVTEGIQTGNQGMILRGANSVMLPELNVGVGGAAPDGNEIIGKRLIGLFPDEQNPDLVHPVLGVDVKRPDGAVGTYHAPITKNRSTDPDDQPVTLSIQHAMDQTSRLKSLAQFMSRPDIAAQLEKAHAEAKPDIDSFLSVYSSLGGALPKKKITHTQIQAGNRVIDIGRDEEGNEVSRETFAKGATPVDRSNALEDRFDAIDADPTLTDEEKHDAKLAAAAGSRGRGGMGGGGAGGGKPPSSAEINSMIRNATDSAAGSIGLTFNPKLGGYVQANGMPATNDQVRQINAAKDEATRAARDAAAAGKRLSGTDLLEAGQRGLGQKAPAAATQFQQGKLYVNGAGQQARYGGKDAAGKDIWLKP